jgi:hypothetical protein
MEKGTLTAARIRDLATGQERGLADPIVVNSWSRDGRFVLGTRDGRVVRCPVEGGPCGTVAEGSFPRPSGDGERIFFMRVARALDDRVLRSTEVWVVAATGGEPRRVAVLEPESSLAHPFDVSLRDEIVWVQFRRGKEELWLAQLPGG